MSLNVIVLDKDLMEDVLEDFKDHTIISKLQSPAYFYRLSDNVTIKVIASLTTKTLRGFDIDVIYCNHETYIKYYQFIGEYRLNSVKNPRVIIL